MERHAETILVRGEHAAQGSEGEKLHVNGERMAMRLWQNEKPGTSKSEHQNAYEYVAYVIEGAVKLMIDGHTIEARKGDSYCVPANTTYSLEITEAATVVEATSPSDRGAVTETE